MQPEPTPEQVKPSRKWWDLGRWLLLVPMVLILLYACSLTAHLGVAFPEPTRLVSTFQATYAPWVKLEIHPLTTGVIQDIPEWQDTTMDDLTRPGNYWPGATVTPLPLAQPSPTPELPNNPRPSSTPAPTRTPTPAGFVPTATRTTTPTMMLWWPTLAPTRTSTLVYLPSATPTFTATFTTAFTRTPTLVTTPSPTLTRTSTQTPTFTATITGTITPSYTSTITPTFTLTHTPSPTTTFTPTFTLVTAPTFTPTITITQPPCGGNIPNGEPDIGPPDGSFASLPCGGLLILDLVELGYSAIDITVADSAYDLVFYERKLPPPDADIIELDWVSVEVGTGPSGSCDTSPYYMAFNWGDYIVTNNGHLGNSYPEIDNQEIPIADLWGIAPLQTGIAINLDDAALGIPPGQYPCIRVISPFNWPDNDPSEVDALEILP